MLEEGSKPRSVEDRGAGAARAGPSWVKSPWISVIGAFLAFLALAGLILVAAYPDKDFDLWPDLQRHYWLIAAASVLACFGFGKRVQADALVELSEPAYLRPLPAGAGGRCRARRGDHAGGRPGRLPPA
jgi:hypothetical protein